jgi:hypothetical protein
MFKIYGPKKVERQDQFGQVIESGNFYAVSCASESVIPDWAYMYTEDESIDKAYELNQIVDLV